MKDSKEYSQKISAFYKSAKRKYGKAVKVSYDEPIEALMSGMLREILDESQADAAMERIKTNFVDLNDLRVSLTEELIEAIGVDTPATREAAFLMRKILNTIFNETNKLSLSELHKMGKRPARQAIEKMEGVSPFVVDYCFLTALRGHAIPLTKKMTEYLLSNELVYPGSDPAEIEGFLARQISAEDAYEFYRLLRKESETAGGNEKSKKSKQKGTKQ